MPELKPHYIEEAPIAEGNYPGGGVGVGDRIGGVDTGVSSVTTLQETKGELFLLQIKELMVGKDNSIFRADHNGIYLGNKNFSSAPFRVTMAGALTASSVTLTGLDLDDIDDGTTYKKVTGVSAGNQVQEGSIAANAITATKISVTNLAAINADMGAITAGTIVLPSGGYVRSGQTAYDTGTGFYLGNDSGTPKFSIGNSTADKLTWDGSTLGVKGGITIDSGSGIANLSDGGDLVTVNEADVDALALTNAPAAANADVTSANTSADTSAVNGLASSTLIVANVIGANLVVATSVNVANLAAINVDAGSLTAGTITGLIVQSSASANTGVKLNSGGIDIYGKTISFKTTGGATTGYMYSAGSDITIEANADLILDAVGVVGMGDAEIAALDYKQTPTASAPTPSHYVLMKFNGTTYRVCLDEN